MKMNNKAKSFFRSDLNLQDKWWHRLLKILFGVTVAIVFLISLAVWSFSNFDSLKARPFNSTVVSNLNEFTRASDPSVPNTIPSFLELEGKLGCREDNSINHLSALSLSKKGVCSVDIIGNADEIVSITQDQNWFIGATDEKLKKDLLEFLAQDEGQRYCMILSKKSDGCSSDNIIKYKRNAFYYLQAFIYSLGIVLISALLLQLAYYKGLIYIIYGKKKT